MEGPLGEFFSSDYMPHGHCYLWQPGILWTHVISDLLIAFSYFSIPFILLYLLKKRADQPFSGIFVLFALFILSCGVTHLFSVYTIWNGSYGLHGLLKAITALFSITTAFVLYFYIDKFIALPSSSELTSALEKASEERLKRVKLEIETKANSIFQFSVELFPTGVLVIDKQQNIQIANKKLEETFGYSPGELKDKNISLLLEPEHAQNHSVLVNDFMKVNTASKNMANNRIVWGRTKLGEQVPIEVTLSVHEFENDKYTFASVMNVTDVGVHKKRFMETSRRLQRAVDVADVGIWEWNLLTNKVWFSSKLLSFIGLEHIAGDVTFEDWFNHIHPDERESVKLRLDRHLKGEDTYDIVYRGTNHSGLYRWFRTTGDTIFDASGKPLLMSGTLMSVDELKNLQTEVENKNQFLDAVLAQSNAAIFIVDIVTNKVIFTNSQVFTMWGYSLNELQNIIQNDGLFSVIHPDDSEILKKHLLDLRHAKVHERFTIEYRMLHKEGHWVWTLSKNSLYSTDNSGEHIEVMGSSIDVSDMKAREESIKHLAKEFLDTFEQAAVGIAHVNFEGRWQRVNGKICEILGYDREELMSKTFMEITHPDDLDEDVELVKKVYNREIDHYIIEKRYINNKGEIIWARLTVSMVLDEHDCPSHYISVIEDIGQQKKLEYELLQSNEELEQFAYVASHDLKEPLRTLQTYTSYLISDLASGKAERVEQDKEFIDSASKRMTSLIDDLLKFSRVGHSEVYLTQCDLNELVSNVIQDLNVKINETQAVMNVANDLPTIETDPDQLRLALQNLIQNALKFTKDDTPPVITIEVDFTPDGKHLLHIKDNGIGIEKAHQQQIFGLFKKLHNASRYNGTGLGLAIVKKIVVRLGGEIYLQSTVNEGSTFTIELPKDNSKEQ